MATEADISDLISPMKIEVEDKERNSGNSRIASEELIAVEEKVESKFIQPFETTETFAARESMQIEHGTDVADVLVVNEDLVKATEGDNFLQSLSVADRKVVKNTEENQFHSIEKLDGSQKGDKIDMKTDENIIVDLNMDQHEKTVFEPTDCSQGTAGKVRDVYQLEEKRDDTLITKAILSQQDSTETSFKGEDESENKISGPPLIEKDEDESIQKVDKFEISKQASDHVVKDIVEDNLKDKPEALTTECKHEEVDKIVTEERDMEETPECEEPLELEQSLMHKNESTTENAEMLVNEASEEIETTSDDIEVLATPEEKNLAAIDVDEKNGVAETKATNKSDDDSNATSPLVEEEVQMISEKLNQVPTSETEDQFLEVSKGHEGEQEGKASDKVIQKTKGFDENVDDQNVKQESFQEPEEPKAASQGAQIEADAKNETLVNHVTECNYEDMTSCTLENEIVANNGEEEAPEETSTPKAPVNEIGNDAGNSEDVSSLVSQAPTEEIYEEKLEDTKNCDEKADIAPPRVTEATSLTEVKLSDKPLEEAYLLKSQLTEHETEKEDLDIPKNLDTESESKVQNVQDIYETTTSTTVEEIGENEIEKIVREVPEELSEALDQGAEAENDFEIAPCRTIQVEETEEQLPPSSSVFLSSDASDQSETRTIIKDKTGLEDFDAVSESKDQKFEEIHDTTTGVNAEEKEEVSENNEAETSESTATPNFHGVEEIKEIQVPVAREVPTDEEKEELNLVPETGNTVNKTEGEITDKTETEFINPNTDEVRQEKFSELTPEPRVQAVEEINESESKPNVGEIQASEEAEETKDVPEKVSELKYQGVRGIIEGETGSDLNIQSESKVHNVEEVNGASKDVGSSKGDIIEKLTTKAPEVSSEPTNQVHEAVGNDDIVTLAVATEVTSSKEFHLNDEPVNVTETTSSEESVETAKKADTSEQNKIEKILEDASTAMSDPVHEDEERDSETAKVDDEVGEARTTPTKSECTDQVNEDGYEMDLSSAVDESNINETAKENKDVPEKLPEAINDAEACSKIAPDKVIAESNEACESNDQSFEETQEMETKLTSEITEEYKMEEESIKEPDITGLEESGEIEPTQTAKENHADEEREIMEEFEKEDMKSDAEEVREEIQSKAVCVQETDELDSTTAVEKTPTTKEKDETEEFPESVSEINSEEVEAIIDEDISPNLTLSVESKEQLTEPFSTLVKDQPHETTTEVEMVKAESINKNDSPLNEDRAHLFETGTTENVVPREVEISNSEVTAQDTQNRTTEKQIDEENIEEKTVTNGTDVTHLGESKLISEPIDEFDTNLETTIPESIETVGTSEQDSDKKEEELKSVAEKISDPSTLDVKAVNDDQTNERPFPTGDQEKEHQELSSALLSPKQDETEESKFSETKAESNVLDVEEANETETTAALEKTRADKVEEETKKALETIPEAKFQDAGAIIDREILSNRTLPPEVEGVKDGVEKTDIAPMEESIKEPDIIVLEESGEIEPTQTAKENHTDEEREEVDKRKSKIMEEFEKEDMKSDAEEVREEIQSKAVCVQETDELDSTTAVEKTPTTKEKDETEAFPESVSEINSEGVEATIDEDISPNQTLPVESKEQLTEPFSTLVKDQPHETKIEVENVKAESINKNNSPLNENREYLFETGTTKNIVPREVENSCSEVTARDTQNKTTEKEIDEENIEEKTKSQETKEALETIPEAEYQDVRAIIDREILSNQTFPLKTVESAKDGIEKTDVAPMTASEVTNIGQINLSSEKMKDCDMSSDSKTPDNIEKVDASQQDSEAESIKPEEASIPESKLAEHENKIEARECATAAETEPDNIEIENWEILGAESESLSVEEICEANASPALGETDTNESQKVVREVPKALLKGLNEVTEANSSDEIAPSRASQAENVEVVQNSSSVFLSNEESRENETTTTQNTEDDNLKLKETSGLLSQPQNIETREISDASEVKAEEMKGFDALCASKDHLDEIHETKTSPSAKISEENIEEKTRCHETDIAVTTGTEVTLLGESMLINEPLNCFGISSETTTPETIETVDTSKKDPEVDGIKLEETSTVESQLLPHEHEAETYERTTAEKAHAENVEVGNSKVPAAVSEPSIHNVEEIREKDTSPAVGDTETTEIENVVREVPEAINQVPEADSSDEIAHGQKIEAENKVEHVQGSSFVFLSGEESRESEAIIIENTEDGHMKKDGTEKNNLKPQKDSAVDSQLQNTETVEESNADVVKDEEATGFYEVCDSTDHLEDETKASQNVKISGADERGEESETMVKRVSGPTTLDVESVIHDEANIRPGPTGGIEEYQELSSALLSEKQDETEESKVSEAKIESIVLGVEEVHETEATTAVENTHPGKVEEETTEALQTIPGPKCRDVEAIIDREILSNKTFPLESIEGAKDEVEETDIAPTTANEVTSDEPMKDAEISSDSKTPETVQTVDACQQNSKIESIKPEEASITETKLADHENKIEAHESVTEAKTESDGTKVENQKVLSAESECSTVEEIHEKNESPAVGETDANENEKVVRELPIALPEGIKQGPEADITDEITPSRTSQAENMEDRVQNSSSVFLSGKESHENETTITKNIEDGSFKLQETSGMISQLQNMETQKISDADEVKTEKSKGFDAVCETKDDLEEIHETKTSPPTEISDEVKMEEETEVVLEKISNIEAVVDDVSADESTSLSNCPAEKADIDANIKHSAADELEEAIVSEPTYESRVLGVEEIHETEMNLTVGKTQTDVEEDEIKGVLEAAPKSNYEDAAEIIDRDIICNQTFPHKNKEDTKSGVEETEIASLAVTGGDSMGEINLIDELVKATDTSSDIKTTETTQVADTTTILDSEIDKAQLQDLEHEKIAHESIVQNVQEIPKTSKSPTLGESDTNAFGVEETKSYSAVAEPKHQAVEDIYETGTSSIVGEADTNEIDQETRETPETVNEDAAADSKEEIAPSQPIEVEKIQEHEDRDFDPVTKFKDQSFEKTHDARAIPAEEMSRIDKIEEDGTKGLEKLSDDACTGVEAIVDGQTQATKTVPQTFSEPNYEGGGEIVAEDGKIKAEDTNKNNALLDENVTDSSEAGTTVNGSSSKPVDKKSSEAFDYKFEKIEKVPQPEFEINGPEVDPIQKMTDIVDKQFKEPVVNPREGETETHAEDRTETAQAIHEIASKESLTEEPEKAEENNNVREAGNSNVGNQEQVSVGMGTARVNNAEEVKEGKYVEKEPIMENESKEYENLATEVTRSIEEVEIPEVKLGKHEDKPGGDNKKDEIATANINNLENRAEKEKMEHESHVPVCEDNGTNESVGIEEQEAIGNASELSSSKTSTEEELANKGEVTLDEKRRGFILDPVSITPSEEEQVEKIEILPTANNQEAIGDVPETKEVRKEPQEQKKISLSLSHEQIARKECISEDKENKNVIASRDFQAIPDDPAAEKQVECYEEGKQEEGAETIEKLTPNDPYEVLSSKLSHKLADQTKQVTEEPKTETEERVLVEEQKIDGEEEDEHKKADSGSDAPVMVEASRDIDVKTPHKKSHNILSGVGSKVKHSIAKVKKVITGKSSHQKTSSPKEDKKTEALPLL